MLLSHFDYLRLSRGALVGFTRLPLHDRDPTEQGQFSTLVGRAMADFLARRLLGVTESLSYEAAMLLRGLKIRGERPDFFCTAGTQFIAIEAKGLARQSLSVAAFNQHKAQACRGSLTVNASVASVTYDIFGSPRVRFHDPPNGDEGGGPELRERILFAYYAPYVALAERFSDLPTRKVADREYIRVPIVPMIDPAVGAVSLLIDKQMARGFAAPFANRGSYEVSTTDDLYIDSDGIGAEVRPIGTGDQFRDLLKALEH